MFDNMTGAVGFAMHEDRLARATTNRRVSEAVQATAAMRGRRWVSVRAGSAKGLLAVAARIAPAVTMPHSRTQRVTG